MSYIDAHTHPQFPLYDADREDVIARAKAADVKIIAVGTQASTSEAAIALAEAHPDEAWATVGFHPNHLVHEAAWYHDTHEQASEAQERFDGERLKDLAKHPKVVAIGECGLDYYRLDARFEVLGASGGKEVEETKERQKEAFRAQMEIARELGKPLMIHCRSAFPDLISILTSSTLNLEPGVVHFMTGTPEDARALLELGFSFTFGGVVTFSRDYDATLAVIPPERILSETDAPYVAPAPYRGKRNEPGYVVETVKKLAELKGLTPEAMRDAIWQNARKLFSLDS